MDECKSLGLNVSKTKLLLFGIVFGLKNVWSFVHTQTHADTLYIYIYILGWLYILKPDCLNKALGFNSLAL